MPLNAQAEAGHQRLAATARSTPAIAPPHACAMSISANTQLNASSPLSAEAATPIAIAAPRVTTGQALT
jgi:hypothetical protein